VATRTEALAPSWKEGSVTSWLTTLDHKRIGLLYIVTSFVFFGAAGVMAMLMRIQLSHANAGFLTKGAYNEVVTMHGTAMVFLFVVPVLAGFGNYLVPLMIGARDMAFPRLNAASYWLFLLGGLVLLSSFLADQGGAQCGWTSYTPARRSSSARATARTSGSSASTSPGSRRSSARSTSSSRSTTCARRG